MTKTYQLQEHVEPAVIAGVLQKLQPGGSLQFYLSHNYDNQLYEMPTGPWSLHGHGHDFSINRSWLLPVATAIVDPTPPDSLTSLIDEICADASNLEPGEASPSIKAISEIKSLIDNASTLHYVPMGDVAPYFGEVSVTWRNGDSMLRVTSFSDATPPRLDFGTTPDGALGDYQFDSHASGEKLAEKLAWLYPKG